MLRRPKSQIIADTTTCTPGDTNTDDGYIILEWYVTRILYSPYITCLVSCSLLCYFPKDGSLKNINTNTNGYRYRGLFTRVIDIVGDFAGDETIILDGDSVLLRIFSDPLLDFQQGFQLLHEIYLVEQFLSNLKRRHCNFVLVFFDCHREVCIPYDTFISNDKDVMARKKIKYHLAREATIQHLQKNTSEKQLILHRFPSYEDETFCDFLKESGAGFFMCHDGSDLSIKGGTNMVKEMGNNQLPYLSSGRAVLMRKMIANFISRDYHVILINEIEFVDSRIMASALELMENKFSSVKNIFPYHQRTDWEFPKKINILEGFSERQALTVFSLAEMIMQGWLDPTKQTPNFYRRDLEPLHGAGMV